MDFSIIIVNYNTKGLIENCLDSIFESCRNANFEIIVVDNNSQDGSSDYLENKLRGKINLIKNNENKGFGIANNQGAEKAKGRYLFFLNGDTTVHRTVLSDLNRLFEKDEKVGIASPKLILPDGQEQKYAYGKFPHLGNLVLRTFASDDGAHDSVFETDWVSGAAFMISADIFRRVRGFDENYFMYFEDVDLCKKVRDLGFKIIVDKNTEIIHLGGKSLAKTKERKRFYYTSQDYFFKKHYGLLSMVLLKAIRLPYELVQR